MKAKRRHFLAVLAVLAAGAFSVGTGTGCASRPQAGVETGDRSAVGLVNPPSKIRFRSYGAVELKAAGLAPGLQTRRDADEYARRTDAALKHDLERLLRNVDVVPRDVSVARTPGATLQILPQIEQASLVSSMKRGWLTWGAGDVELVIRVTYLDGKTGEVLAEPVFRRVGNNFWGSWSNGQADDETEGLIVADIIRYTGDNL